MKLEKLYGYAPEYPKKNPRIAARLGSLAAAAVLAVGTTVGCVSKASAKDNGGDTGTNGSHPADTEVCPTDYPDLDGAQALDTDCTDEPVIDGEICVDPDETALPEIEGKIVVDPTEPPLPQGGMLADPTELPVPMGDVMPDPELP